MPGAGCSREEDAACPLLWGQCRRFCPLWTWHSRQNRSIYAPKKGEGSIEGLREERNWGGADFELVLEKVFLVRKLAIQAEELLLFFG